MKLDKSLFATIAQDATHTDRLRKNFDLRDDECEGCQRMLNILLPGSKTPIHKHQDSSEVVVCISGTIRERLYNSEGREIECVLLEAGGDCPGITIEKNQFHSLEATDVQGVVLSVKSGNYAPLRGEDIIIL